jgi:UDP-N-acetylmuramyl pentapeptide phosphotransferase/UDP-N-acetylglucosamine-1-phosphate transferase
MDRRLEWIVGNGAFAVALYFALVEQVDWIQVALIGVVWWLLLKTLWVIPDGAKVRRLAPAAVPPLGGMAFDLGVLAALFLAHWHWTAFAYAATCGCVALIDARRPSRR